MRAFRHPRGSATLPIGSQQATTWWEQNLANPDSAESLLQRARKSQFLSNPGELGADLAHRACCSASPC